MWKAVIVLAIINKIVFWGFCSDICDDRSAVTECDYAITPHPIVDNIISARSGIAQETCMGLLMKFKFDFGVYCETSVFCGLGLELEKDYSHLALSDNFPVYEKCLVIVNQKRHTCESVKIKLYEAGLLSDQLLCSWTGNKYCLTDKKALCVQLEGNFMCDGCYPGYEPVDPPSEQDCQDRDECHLNYCGDRKCEDLDGTYTCTCPIGYIFSPSVARGCFEELPGYSVEMVYFGHAGTDMYFQYYHSMPSVPIDGVTVDPKLTNYVNPDAHENILEATEIVFVVYDEINNPREQLTFRGNHVLDGWFNVNNVLSSSKWEVSSESDFEVFEMKITKSESWFEISESKDSCEGTGFLMVNCDKNEDCPNFQWWEENQNLNGKVCAIKYSKLRFAAAYEDAYVANKFTIFTYKYPVYNETWLLNFRFSSFTKARFLDFLKNGGVASDGLNYRDKNIVDNFKKAKYIMLVLYGESDDVKKTFVFKVSTPTLENWFDPTLLQSPEFPSERYQMQFKDVNELTFLNIGTDIPWIHDCENAFGGLTIACKPIAADDNEKLCPFQQFWYTRDTDGYCAIMYSTVDTGTKWSSGGFKYASKIEIATSTVDPSENAWKLVFKVPSYSNIDFYPYFENGQLPCTSNSNCDRVNPEDHYRHGDLQNELAEASKISVRVFSDDSTVAVDMLFQGTGDAESWFDFSQYSPGSPNIWGALPSAGVNFDLINHQKYFHIWQSDGDASQDNVWFFILTTQETTWVLNLGSNGSSIPEILNKGTEYPEIRYRQGSGTLHEKDFEVAEKIEIWVKEETD